MDNILLMAQENARRAREGRLQAEQRQRQRGAEAAAARPGPATRTREGGFF